MPTTNASYSTEPRLPNYTGGDADFTHLPRVQAAPASIPQRHRGGPGTSFRYVWSLQATTWVISAFNVGTVGPSLKAERTDEERANLRRSPIHRERSLTHDEWRHLIWLVNLAQIERLSPATPGEMIGSTDYGMAFTMETPEGNASIERAGAHYEDDNFRYVLAYLRQLAGDGF